MRKSAIRRGVLLMGVAGMIGCSNGEIDLNRRASTAGYEINGTSYASAKDNDANALGTEIDGLSDNPKTKPSSEYLGEAGKYKDVTLSSEPKDPTVFVNDVVEVTIKVTGKGSQSAETASLGPLPNTRIVVVLEKAAGANGTMAIVDNSKLIKGVKQTDRRIVANTDSSGEVKVLVYVGTTYNDSKPIYYVNAWQADAEEPSSTAITVRKLPKMSELTKGDSDVVNDMTAPTEMDSITDASKDIEIVQLDQPIQQLYCSTSALLHVKLQHKSGDSNSENAKPAPGEPVCWKLVAGKNFKHGVITGDSDKQKISDTDTEKCSKADEEGKYWVEFYTGDLYNARYYVNFFHPNASPVSYQIDTFAAPDTVGAVGDEAKPETVEVDVDGGLISADTDSKTGGKYLSACKAQKVIEQVFSPEDEPGKTISGICKDEKLTCPDDFKCKENYKCKLSQRTDGTWAIIKCDGTEVRADVDGDGKADDIHIILDTEKDESGKDVVSYGGTDTDGDGKPDVIDICATSKAPADMCPKDAAYTIVWSKENKDFATKKLSTPIGTDFEIYVKSRKGTSASGAALSDLKAKVVRGGLVTNDAKLKNGKSEVDEMTFSTESDGIGNLTFWSGSAYGALYYVQVTHPNAKGVQIPIATTNAISLPGGEGSAPESDEDAKTPPSDMGIADPNLGECYLSIDEEEIKKIIEGGADKLTSFTTERMIETPVVKTLVLKAAVVKKKNNSVVSDTKTYWKVTRGKTSYNNATLMSSVNSTDSKGVASSQFYTGTGYGSVYYVSVFHPNVTDSKGKAVPAIYTIKTLKSSGTAATVDPSEEPEKPSGDTTVNAALPKKACSSAACVELDKDGKPANECAEGNVDKDNTGCLWLSIDEQSPIQSVVDGSASIHATLLWREGKDKDGSVTPVKDSLIWTLNVSDDIKGNPNAGKLMSEKTMTNKKGKAIQVFNAGAYTTTYKVNVMHPNFIKDGSMQAVSVMVNVVDKTQEESSNKGKNSQYYINVNTDSKASNVVYYVLSSDYNTCSKGFVLQSRTKVNDSCKKAPGNPSWKNGEKTSGLKDAMCGKSDDPDSATGHTSIQVPDGESRYMAYAISFGDDGGPVKYGCVDMQYLPANTCAADDENCKVELNLTIPLNDIPLTLGTSYNTKSLIDLGELVEIPDKCEGDCRDIGCNICKYMEYYDKYIKTKPGKTLIEKLNKFVFDDCMSNDKAEPGLGNWDADCKKNGEVITGQALINDERYVQQKCCASTQDNKECVNKVTTSCNQPNSYGGQSYAKSTCVCGKIKHWTGYDSKNPNQCVGCNQFVSAVKPFLLLGLEALIDRAFAKADIENVMCQFVDGLQFFELTGDLKFTFQKNPDGSQKDDNIGVTVNYTGAKIPFTEKTITIGRAITGNVNTGRIPSGEDSIMFSGVKLNLSYGLLIYDIIKGLLGEKVFDKDGNIAFSSLINCSKLLGLDKRDITIPKIDFKITAEIVDSLCGKVFATFNDKIVDFANSKNIKLNMSLDGYGSYYDTGCTESNKIGCKADTIKNGIWMGKGTMHGRKASIAGLWVAKSGNADFPALTYGDKTVEEFMAERSICRKKLKEAKEKEENDTPLESSNKSCLMGTYDNPKARVSNNYCKSDQCKGKGIVVCKEDGQFNALYANASAAEIIKAANTTCIKNQDDASCKNENNPEIINGGKGITNLECLEKNCSKEAGCMNNPSIVVCPNEGVLMDDNVIKESCGSLEEFKACATNACEGQCDAPGCVMNTDVINCGAKPGETSASTPEIIASWNFNGCENNDALKGDPKDDQKDDQKCVGKSRSCKIEVSGGKLVTGKDGKLGAVGFVKKGSKITIDCSGAKVQRFEFNVKGVGRTINYGDGNKKTDDSSWQSISYITTKNPMSIEIETDLDPTMPIMRVDDIVVYGTP